MIAQVTAWPDAVKNVAVAFAIVGVAWAIAWASVQMNRDDPFWNRNKRNDK